MSSNSHQYNFYVIATAMGGAILQQQVFIYNFKDCNEDFISLNYQLPNRSDPNYENYVNQTGFPVLKINKPLGSYFKANL